MFLKCHHINELLSKTWGRNMSMSKHRCVVTGGAGFIGSHIVEDLLKEGKEVTVIDNFYTGKKENLSFLDDFPEEERSRCKIITGDVRDYDLVRDAVKGTEYIIHHAAIISVSESVFEPLLTNEVNVNGTLNILMAAKEEGIKRVVFASSSAIYDDNYEYPHVEDKNILPYSSPYAASKYIGELYCKLFFRLYNLETVSLRYFNVYGPRQDPNGEYAAVIPKFITEIMNKRAPVIYGDGKQTRDFIFVKDVVRANLLACRREGVSSEAFNIGQGNNTSVEELLKNIKELMDSDIKHEYKDKRPGDVRYSIADTSKSKALLGMEPQISLQEGLNLTIEWLRKNGR